MIVMFSTQLLSEMKMIPTMITTITSLREWIDKTTKTNKAKNLIQNKTLTRTQTTQTMILETTHQA